MRAEGSLGSPQKEASEAGFLFFSNCDFGSASGDESVFATGFHNGEIYSSVTACYHQQSKMALLT